METLLIFLSIVMILYGLMRYFFSVAKLKSYIGKNYPLLLSELDLMVSTEVSGYSNKLAIWVSSNSYKKLNDDVLEKVVSKYKQSKIAAIFYVLIGGLMIVAISSHYN
ncbi:hypothetical protein OFY17_13050 [Marinomonas sp. C2222]|uniref:Universal stress protein B n=1 Tax=Marinomonas sargassi TaxID=2984494 RepID=A0ABT2YV68_9GAMM|nr:hypothetical protein [Marinomonas sargassi]MCV2403794.1 hypothetical protein [Marinomonas sargassi]